MKQRSILRTAALCAMLFLVLSLAALAVNVPKPTSDFYVNDFAGVLSQSTKDAIIAKNEQLEQQTGAQIVVTVVDNAGGLSMEELAYQMFNQWEIGDADENNGVLLLLSIEDDDYHCLQGKGLERLLPTTTLSRILQEDLEPDFAARDYDAGVYKTFLSLYDEVDSIYANGGTAHSGGYDAAETKIKLWGMIVLLIVGLIVISTLSRFLRRLRYHFPFGSGYASGYAAGRMDGSRRRYYDRSYRSSGSSRSNSYRSGSSHSSFHSGGGGSSRGGGAGRGH